MTYNEFHTFNNSLTDPQRKWLMRKATEAGQTMFEFASTGVEVPLHDRLNFNGHELPPDQMPGENDNRGQKWNTPINNT